MRVSATAASDRPGESRQALGDPAFPMLGICVGP